MGLNIEYDHSALKGKIVEKYGSVRNFAKAFGVTEVTMSTLLNNKADWSRTKISKAIRLLDLEKESDKYIHKLFFTEKIKKS